MQHQMPKVVDELRPCTHTPRVKPGGASEAVPSVDINSRYICVVFVQTHSKCARYPPLVPPSRPARNEHTQAIYPKVEGSSYDRGASIFFPGSWFLEL